jgi:hypothetical protein
MHAERRFYGAFGASAYGFDVVAGVALGLVMEIFGDELAGPLLGLQRGSTVLPSRQHANRFRAHLAYGLGTSVTTRLLLRLLGST